MTAEQTPAEHMADRLFNQSIVVMEAAAVWLGQRLGWYAALRDVGEMTADELAGATASHPRYAREWLEQQAVTGILDRDGERFSLPVGHAEALLDRDSGNWSEPLIRQVFAATQQMTRLAEVYRQGGGVPWDTYGDAMSWSQGDANRPLLLHALAAEWVPQIPALQQRLTAGGRLADVASGHGWSSVGLALTFPEIEVHGYDMDPVAITAAQRNAEDRGVADRVHFHLGEITGPLPHGPFEAAIAIECIHDMPYPVEVLSALRASCVDDAVVVVIDEAADPDLMTPGDEIQRLLYGFSLLICLPDSLSHAGSVGTGTLIRPAVMDEYAKAAGFAGATPLEVADTGFWRCYRLPLS